MQQTSSTLYFSIIFNALQPDLTLIISSKKTTSLLLILLLHEVIIKSGDKDSITPSNSKDDLPESTRTGIAPSCWQLKKHCNEDTGSVKRIRTI